MTPTPAQILAARNAMGLTGRALLGLRMVEAEHEIEATERVIDAVKDAS